MLCETTFCAVFGMPNCTNKTPQQPHRAVFSDSISLVEIMGDWDDEDEWEADAALGALDSKLGATKTAWEEEDEVEVSIPEVAKPAEATLAAKAKAIAAQDAKLNNQVKYALQAEEGMEDKKARERRQVEEADHALTEDLMGSGAVKPAKKSLGSASSGALGLAAITLNTISDHKTFGVTISKKIQDSTPLTVVAFMKSLLDNLPPAMTTESLDQILSTLTAKRTEKAAKEGEQAKLNKATKTKKQIKADEKRHKDVFGGVDKLDDYYEQYGSIEDDFM